MLTKIKRLHKQVYPSGQFQWMSLYVCDCGKNIERLETSVKNLEKSHCGCKLTNRHNLKYGKELESRWNGIKKRTENGFKNKDKTQSKCYENVLICNEWKNDFMSFYNWSIENGYKEGLTIDRIDNDRNYEPLNCRWVNMQLQQRNTRLLRSTNSSGYRGVSFKKDKNKWDCKINVNYKRIHIGYFKTAEEGARAYDKYVIDNNLEHPTNFKREDK